MNQTVIDTIQHTNPVELDLYPVEVDVAATIADVVAQMCHQNIHEAHPISTRLSYVLVLDAGTLVGILTERDVLRLTLKRVALDKLQVKDCISRDLITLKLHEVRNPVSVLEVMRRHQIRHLPILDDQDQVAGVATVEKLRQSLRSRDFLKLRQVSEVMTRQVITATPQEAVIDLVQRMVDRQISCVVIMEPWGEKNEALRPIGIITERDVVQMQNLNADLTQLTAAETMSTPLFCVSPQQNLWDVQQKMKGLRVRRLVVAQENQLLGIVTQTNLLTLLDPAEMYNTIALLQSEVEQLKSEREEYLQQRNIQLKAASVAAERRFEAVFNNTFQFNGLMTPSGLLLEVNQTALDWGGVTLDDVMHRPFWETHWWTRSPQAQQQLQQAIHQAAQGHSIRYEVEILGHSEQVMWIDFSIRPLRDDSGQVVLLIAEGRDISRLKQVEQSLTFQTEFDRLVAEISNRFIGADDIRIAAKIEQAFYEISNHIQIDASYTTLYSTGHGIEHQQIPLCDVDEQTFVWVHPTLSNQEGYPPTLTCEMFPWMIQQAQMGQLLHITQREDLPLSAEMDRQMWQTCQIQSLLAIPFTNRIQVYGFVVFVSFRQTHHWSESQIQLLKIFAETITNALHRQQTEYALQRSQDNYHELITRIPVGVYKLRSHTDRTFSYDFVSPRWCELNQLSADAVMQDAALAFALVHPDDLMSLVRCCRKSESTLSQLLWEGRLVINGEIRWMHWHAQPTRLGNGDVIWDGLQCDITERKRTEVELQNSEQRYATLAESIPIGVFRTDRDGRWTYVSEQWCHIIGLSRPMALGESWVNTVHPADRADVVQHWQRCIQEKSRFYHEFRVLNGHNVWVFVQAVPEFDADGTYRGYIGGVTDITDRKQAEFERLQAKHVRYELKLLENVLEIVLAGYWDWDIPRNIEYLSPRFKQMFGYRDDELPNTPDSWQRLVFAKDLPEVMNCFERHVQSHGDIPFYTEVRYRHRDGSTVWVICSGQVIEWDEQGNPLRMIGCHVNISDRKRAEQKLKQTIAQLEATNHELESFSYSVSHDLRAPLRHIHGFVNALRQQLTGHNALTDGKVVRYLETIESSSQKMALLIDNLLKLSRIGRQSMTIKPTPLQHLVEEAIALVRSSAETPSTTQFILGQLPTVQADASLLQQVFSNLISNAVKFSRPVATPRIEIGTTTQGIIYVKDNGVGFDMKYADKLFGAFQRLHSQAEFEGTGIGLAIVQRIIHRHGGQIWVESQLNQGTTFYLSLGSYGESHNQFQGSKEKSDALDGDELKMTDGVDLC